MFHSDASFGVLLVYRILPLADFLALHITFDDTVLELELAHHPFHSFPYICAVAKKILTSVAFVHKFPDGLGVVLFGGSRHAFLYELALGVGLRVVLVTIMFLAAILCPTGVYVLVPLFVGFAFFLVFGVALLEFVVIVRHLNKAEPSPKYRETSQNQLLPINGREGCPCCLVS